MFETIKQNRELRKLERELQIKEATASNLQYTQAIKFLTEASNVVVDTELKDWNILSSRGRLDESGHKDMQVSAYSLYHTNVHARAIVRTLVKFVLGIGPKLEPKESDNKKVKEAWKDFRKANKFSRREKEIATRLFRDGEVFLRIFTDESNGKITLRFIRSSLIATPQDRQFQGISFGIKTNPEDIEDVIEYYRCDYDGNWKETIPAKEIIHLKIFADSDEKRGVSVYKVCANRISQYDGWLEDRIALNKVRSAIALIRKVSGSAANIRTLRDKNRSDNVSADRNKQKTPYRGTVITASKDIEYEMLSPNINATDVKDDGRAILLSIAAGIGFPEMMFTADYSNANYSSSLIAQNPFVREIEEWQDFFKDFYQELFTIIIEAGMEYGELPANTDTDCIVEFPPLIAADIGVISKAYEILFKYKIVSKKTWRYKMGLDDEMEKYYIEEEEELEVEPPAGFNPNLPALPGVPGQKQPGALNMPISPINQYGAQMEEMREALKERDWDRIIELADEIESGNITEAEVIDHNDDLELILESNRESSKEIAEAIAEGLGKIKIENTVNNTPPEVNIVNEAAIINVTTPENIINIPESKPPDIKVVNEAPVVNVTTPENKINITNPENIINVNVPENPLTITTPETRIENIINLPKEDKKKKKSKKTILKDKDGNITGIEEEEL
uniref:Putative portal protein n=1 Tax=viral metagenome TaxID=1070528 RepID=A0A6M3JYX7_9ZZZZ